MKYAVVTFGCRVNQADSFGIEDALRARGGIDVPPQDADLVIVNTCSVTASADQGTRQTVRRIARDNPGVRVVVTGCYATRRPDEAAGLPNVVQVITNDRKDALVALLDSAGLTTSQRYGDGDGSCGSQLRPGVAGRTALAIGVQTGCDEACSYCVIPSTRGHGRSRPLATVLEDIRRATAAGYREMAVTGVHLGSYGRDLGDGTTLDALVGALAEWPDDVLFRISSLEPMDCTPGVVRTIAGSSRLAPHFHLPLQHGSDAVLRAMRRPYSVAFYRGLVDDIHARLPHASIGSDIIVGFPGETDEDFARTLDVLDRLPLSHLHVFPYSDRPGTAATAMAGAVSGSVIRARARAVRNAGTRLSQAFQARQIGTTRRALTVDDGSRAVTDNFLKVSLTAGRPRNEWVDVIIRGVPGALDGDTSV